MFHVVTSGESGPLTTLSSTDGNRSPAFALRIAFIRRLPAYGCRFVATRFALFADNRGLPSEDHSRGAQAARLAAALLLLRQIAALPAGCSQDRSDAGSCSVPV